jgi:transcriptional regulator with XRE-family HTH domain
MRLWTHRLCAPFDSRVVAKPNDPELAALGARLRALRVDRGMTQEDLAGAAGLHISYVGQIERGERNLSYKNLLRLARGLGVKPASLVGSL